MVWLVFIIMLTQEGEKEVVFFWGGGGINFLIIPRISVLFTSARLDRIQHHATLGTSFQIPSYICPWVTTLFCRKKNDIGGILVDNPTTSFAGNTRFPVDHFCAHSHDLSSTHSKVTPNHLSVTLILPSKALRYRLAENNSCQYGNPGKNRLRKNF